MTRPFPPDIEHQFWAAAMQTLEAYGDEAPTMVQGVIAGCRERGDEQGAIIWEWILVRLGDVQKPPHGDA